MAQVVVELSADESKLLRAFQKIQQGQQKVDGGFRKTQASAAKAAKELQQFAEHTKKITSSPIEKYRQHVAKLDAALKGGLISQQTYNRSIAQAGAVHEQSFGASAVSRMAQFAASAFGVQQIFSRMVQFMREADAELDALAAKQIGAAGGLGELQQLSNDPTVVRKMRAEARKTFLSGGAENMDKAGELQFALESAGIPEMRADFAALQSNKIVKDAAVMA